MKRIPAPPIALRRLVTVAALALLAAIATTARVEAQMVAVMVNGEPVTNYDIEQRSKLIQLSTNKSPSRQQVLDDLIDEKLKIQLLRRYNIPDIDKDVENALSNMSRRMRATPKQFTEQLARSGVMPETLKSRIKAEIVWSQVIRGRFQSSFQFSDKDILARLQSSKPEGAETTGFDYTLRPILFVVPRGSPPAEFEARRKEAEAFRTRFQSCEQSISYARALPYVAVRPPVVKSSSELPPSLREVLEKTELGHVTAPEATQQGIEVYALCAKKQSSADNAPAKKQMRDEMFKEAFERLSKQYLKELRTQAMIEHR
ncbi:MAG: peptidylprolyl isomerase [Xanthobacteraceae bacterium]